jgi:lipoprotein-anchoring transpeptidase ErfK/SrfK
VNRGPSFRSVVATAKGPRVGIYHSANDPAPYMRLSNPNGDGATLAFLVKGKLQGKWAHVYLPSRPNGSTGWIRLSKVKLSGHNFHVKINLTRHFLTAWNGKDRILKTPVGVGRAVTPTPAGLYYITELLKPRDPTGTYGPYAFGLSAHSDVLHEFAGGDGVLGIHGTNFPQGIGTDVSHGCIRMSNASIIKLAHTLPVGTPVRVVGTV